jgi:hypothetical protein
MRPLQLNDEEMNVLLTLAGPIDQAWRPKFLQEVAQELEAKRQAGEVGEGLVIGWRVRFSGSIGIRQCCPMRARWRAPRGRSSTAGTLWATPRLSVVERPGFFASASVGANNLPRKLDGVAGMQLGASSVPATMGATDAVRVSTVGAPGSRNRSPMTALS